MNRNVLNFTRNWRTKMSHTFEITVSKKFEVIAETIEEAIEDIRQGKIIR